MTIRRNEFLRPVAFFVGNAVGVVHLDGLGWTGGEFVASCGSEEGEVEVVD
jgi:hypothetical protein